MEKVKNGGQRGGEIGAEEEEEEEKEGGGDDNDEVCANRFPIRAKSFASGRLAWRGGGSSTLRTGREHAFFLGWL